MDNEMREEGGLQRVSIADLLDGAIPHEEWLAPLDPQLRNGLALAGAGMGIGTILSAAMIPGAGGVAAVALVVNLAGLVLLGILAWKTDNFQAGTMPWHRVGTGLVALGATDLVIVSAPIAAAALFVLFWAAVVVLVGAVILLVLVGSLLFR